MKTMWPFRLCWLSPPWSSYLIRTKKRTALSLILETAEPRDVHHFATLLGYGATRHQPLSGAGVHRRAHRCGPAGQGLSRAAMNDYNTAISDGIVKIASKMGISTLQSYQWLPRSLRPSA